MANIKTGKYKVIESGLFHALEDEESVIQIEDLVVKIVFETEDDPKKNLRTETIDGKNLKIILTNFNDNLGVGNTDFLKIGEAENYEGLYVVLRVYSLSDKKIRTIQYSFYLKENV